MTVFLVIQRGMQYTALTVLFHGLYIASVTSTQYFLHV
jgi:hypothetical protein